MESENQDYHEIITDKKEIEALEKFKTNLKMIINKNDKTFINPLVISDNDTLIIFLRARYLDINKATTMISNYFQWKETIKLDDIYLNYQFKEKNRLKLLFPHGFHKMTKDGYPIYLHTMACLNLEEFYKIATPEEMAKFAIKTVEGVIREYFKACSQLKGSYIYGVFGIVDFRGINSSILSKKFMSYTRALLKLLDYYPELVEAGYVINAGLIFRAFYSACKIFIDSRTRKKIKVFGSNYQQYLLEKVDKENLPKFFGGECECPGGCLFSNAGPWKKPGEIEEELPEDILKRREEINHIMATKK